MVKKWVILVLTLFTSTHLVPAASRAAAAARSVAPAVERLVEQVRAHSTRTLSSTPNSNTPSNDNDDRDTTQDTPEDRGESSTNQSETSLYDDSNHNTRNNEEEIPSLASTRELEFKNRVRNFFGFSPVEQITQEGAVKIQEVNQPIEGLRDLLVQPDKQTSSRLDLGVIRHLERERKNTSGPISTFKPFKSFSDAATRDGVDNSDQSFEFGSSYITPEEEQQLKNFKEEIEARENANDGLDTFIIPEFFGDNNGPIIIERPLSNTSRQLPQPTSVERYQNTPAALAPISTPQAGEIIAYERPQPVPLLPSFESSQELIPYQTPGTLETEETFAQLENPRIVLDFIKDPNNGVWHLHQPVTALAKHQKQPLEIMPRTASTNNLMVPKQQSLGLQLFDQPQTTLVPYMQEEVALAPSQKQSTHISVFITPEQLTKLFQATDEELHQLLKSLVNPEVTTQNALTVTKKQPAALQLSEQKPHALMMHEEKSKTLMPFDQKQALNTPKQDTPKIEVRINAQDLETLLAQSPEIRSATMRNLIRQLAQNVAQPKQRSNAFLMPQYKKQTLALEGTQSVARPMELVKSTATKMPERSFFKTMAERVKDFIEPAKQVIPVAGAAALAAHPKTRSASNKTLKLVTQQAKKIGKLQQQKSLLKTEAQKHAAQALESQIKAKVQKKISKEAQQQITQLESQATKTQQHYTAQLEQATRQTADLEQKTTQLQAKLSDAQQAILRKAQQDTQRIALAKRAQEEQALQVTQLKKIAQQAEGKASTAEHMRIAQLEKTQYAHQRAAELEQQAARLAQQEQAIIQRSTELQLQAEQNAAARALEAERARFVQQAANQSLKIAKTKLQKKAAQQKVADLQTQLARAQERLLEAENSATRRAAELDTQVTQQSTPQKQINPIPKQQPIAPITEPQPLVIPSRITEQRVPQTPAQNDNVLQRIINNSEQLWNAFQRYFRSQRTAAPRAARNITSRPQLQQNLTETTVPERSAIRELLPARPAPRAGINTVQRPQPQPTSTLEELYQIVFGRQRAPRNIEELAQRVFGRSRQQRTAPQAPRGTLRRSRPEAQEPETNPIQPGIISRVRQLLENFMHTLNTPDSTRPTEPTPYEPTTTLALPATTPLLALPAPLASEESSSDRDPIEMTITTIPLPDTDSSEVHPTGPTPMPRPRLRPRPVPRPRTPSRPALDTSTTPDATSSPAYTTTRPDSTATTGTNYDLDNELNEQPEFYDNATDTDDDKENWPNYFTKTSKPKEEKDESQSIQQPTQEPTINQQQPFTDTYMPSPLNRPKSNSFSTQPLPPSQTLQTPYTGVSFSDSSKLERTEPPKVTSSIFNETASTSTKTKEFIPQDNGPYFDPTSLKRKPVHTPEETHKTIVTPDLKKDSSETKIETIPTQKVSHWTLTMWDTIKSLGIKIKNFLRPFMFWVH